METKFSGRIWIVGGANVITIPKTFIKFKQVDKNKEYEVILKEVESQ